jgi:hypothetical protein
MNIQSNDFQSTYRQHIDAQKASQQKLLEQAKSVSNPEVRKYLEQSNKVMQQLNQLDEFVLSSTSQKSKPQGFFDKVKAFFKK